MTLMTLMLIHTPTLVSNSTGTTRSSPAIAGRDTRPIGHSVTLVWKKALRGNREKTVTVAHPQHPGALTSSGVNGREAQRTARIIGTRTDREMDFMIKPWLPCLTTLIANIPLVMRSVDAVPTERAT